MTDAFYTCQQMLAIAIFITLQIANTRAQESPQAAVFEIVNKSMLFDETPFSERISDSLRSCSQQCTRDKRCKSANFVKSEEMCALMDKTRRTHPLLFQEQDNIIYLQKVWQIIDPRISMIRNARTVEILETTFNHYLIIYIW